MILFLNNKLISIGPKFYSKKQIMNKMLDSSNFSKEEIDIINMPNFTLGFQYIKSIIDNNYSINYHTIQRLYNNYYDTIPTTKIASATSLRTLLKNNEDITNYLPYHKNNIINLNKVNLNFLHYCNINILFAIQLLLPILVLKKV